MTRLVRPDEHDDPVAAVLSAHRSGARLALSTSGTTGATPRRVVRTTQSWWDSFPAYSELTGVAVGARVWAPGPLGSTMNLFAAVHAAWAGADVIDDPAQADHACLTPFELERRGDELPRGTRVVVAGAHLPDRLAAAAQQRGLRITHYYGAAELSFVAAASSDGDGVLRPFRAVDIQIRDEPAPGTIWARSPWLCDGYAGPPGSLLRAAGGWATVGDIGSFESGVLVVRGRPDAIVTAGATVLIADVEAVLAPAARGGVAVHAVPHPTMGALVAATLTLAADRETLERLARDRLPVTHRPRVWRVVPQLPLTDGGKVDRAALAR
ncbi:MAG TPA: long-chain fatty acid--CoA ligase [Intrasporangium sp.]|uniref:AMP-binding enzyme n=1 Tax=Intrasporangium sp. TaxID=1925024 RepID=UPI002B48AA48|nr:long-chain fatty acid--CoA ligase [Intrasporangium sp.]HKX66277.1 long-chain fatty acid--CoA ligase [Intrasporangium sp.]